MVVATLVVLGVVVAALVVDCGINSTHLGHVESHIGNLD